MSADGNRGRGRARATARGKTPSTLGSAPGQSRGPGGQAQVRRPGQPSTAPKSAGRGAAQQGVTSGVAQLSVASTSGPSNEQGSGDQAKSRGGMRGQRQIQDQSQANEGTVVGELLRTRNASLACKKGSGGQLIKVRANYFKLDAVTNWCLYHYVVRFTAITEGIPEEDRIGVKKGLIKERLRQLTNGAGFLFDGSSLFLSTKLHNDLEEFVAKRHYDDAEFKVEIQFTNDVQPSDLHYLQVFGILVRKCLRNLNLQLIGRNYFDKVEKKDIAALNLSVWPGYMTSIRQHENDILMNAEVLHKVMRRDTALDLARNLHRNCSQNDFQSQKRIIGASVMTRYNDRHYRVSDVDFKVSPKNEFTMKDGSRISYKDYYQTRYNVTITDPHQPLLVSKTKSKELRSGAPDFVYLVPELCLMTGLDEEMMADFRLMRQVSAEMRVGPRDRIQRLMNLNHRLQTVPKVVEDLKEWNLQLSQDLVTFDARCQRPFTILAGDEAQYSVGEEWDWTRELRSNALYCSKNIDRWVVVVPRRFADSAKRFVEILVKAAAGMRVCIAWPAVEIIEGDRINDYLEAIEKILSNGLPQMLMTVLPNNRGDRYQAIKKKCYCDRTVSNQVILTKTTLNKGVMSIATKVAIQMVCKMGGAPWALRIPIKKMMVVGFDVHHCPGIRERSWGAMVASLNDSHSRYYSSVSPHKTGDELSESFGLNMALALRAYKNANDFLPERIVIYRDGVGDGQIPFVQDTEIKNIKIALRDVYAGDTLPKLVFIVVTKRISTRIFTLDGDNPTPGTTVDDVITFPHKFDFYIVSQSVRQGTVTPTSYNVIYDEGGFSPEQLQRLTYALTHLYYNWSGTIRVPAPCQYAHKLAYLVGTMLHKTPKEGLQSLLYFL